MDNVSAFSVNQYDDHVRKVIPFYDEMQEQIFGLIAAWGGQRPLALLDTGCGTGTFALKACQRLALTELVVCDPSETMLADARRKLEGQSCRFLPIGSEELPFEGAFDVVTAIQCHHYFDKAARERAVRRCFSALKPGGLFVCFENTAPFSATGTAIMLRQLEAYERRAGRTPEEIAAHSARYNTAFFPITIREHLSLLHRAGFGAAELFWHSYMQSGFYAVKG